MGALQVIYITICPHQLYAFACSHGQCGCVPPLELLLILRLLFCLAFALLVAPLVGCNLCLDRLFHIKEGSPSVLPHIFLEVFHEQPKSGVQLSHICERGVYALCQ